MIAVEVEDATRRTRLATERTYLAWWRSGLAALAVGLAAGRLVPELSSSSYGTAGSASSRLPYDAVSGRRSMRGSPQR
jgi:uncharacterized membrane protein YidH (DUF202 family)